MIVLKHNDTLEVKLAAAKASLDNPVTVHYVDLDSTTFATVGVDRQMTSTNGTAVVTACTTPGVGVIRIIKKLTLAVKDTASVGVTLQINDSSTVHELMIGTVLSVGDTLQDDGE
jgi:hypothetical protein